jgi:S-adenosylmethionine decarboxylase
VVDASHPGDADQFGPTRLSEPFGWELAIDLHGCSLDAICDEGAIRQFIIRLCDDILEMRRFEDSLVVRFGANDPKTLGYSFVQLIETSSIVGHVAESRAAVYVNIFSCRAYDPRQVEAFARQAFGASDCRSQFLIRE